MATDFPTNQARQRDKLAATYRALPAVEQEILQLFSVVYEPVSRTTFVSCCGPAGLRDESGRIFVNKTLKPHLDKLLAEDLLLQESGQGPQCHRLLTEIATRDAVRSGRFAAMAEAVQTRIPIYTPWKHAPRHFANSRQFLREVRIGIYNQDLEFINQQFDAYQQHGYRRDPLTLEDIAQQVFNNPFDREWFRAVPTEIYESVLATLLIHAVLRLEPAEDIFSLLEEDCLASGQPCRGPLPLILTEQLIFRGRLREAEDSMAKIPDEYRIAAGSFQGWLALLRGDHSKAIEHYSAALAAMKKALRKRKAYLNSISGLFFILALLKARAPEALREAEDHAGIMAKQPQHWLAPIYATLHLVLQIQRGDLSKKDELLATRGRSLLKDADGLQTLMGALCLYWTDPDRAKKRLPPILKPFYDKATNAGYRWLAMEAAELLARLEPRGRYTELAATLRAESGSCTLVDVITPQRPWELSLNALANLNQEADQPTKALTKLRLAWFLTVHRNGWSLQPREQKSTPRAVGVKAETSPLGA